MRVCVCVCVCVCGGGGGGGLLEHYNEKITENKKFPFSPIRILKIFFCIIMKFLIGIYQ